MDALLAQELLIFAGGLRVCDTSTGMAIVPGCCAGLEDWRDLTQAITGGSPWLGHDPGPEVEVVGDDLRVWQDGGPNRHRGPWAGLHLDMPRSALPERLMRAQQDLVGFLAALTAWTERADLGRRGLASLSGCGMPCGHTRLSAGTARDGPSVSTSSSHPRCSSAPVGTCLWLMLAPSRPRRRRGSARTPRPLRTRAV